jgi:hypothetical protein
MVLTQRTKRTQRAYPAHKGNTEFVDVEKWRYKAPDFIIVIYSGPVEDERFGSDKVKSDTLTCEDCQGYERLGHRRKFCIYI